MIFIGPPDTRSDPLASRNDEMLAEIVTSRRYAANPRRALTDGRHAFVKHLDLVVDSLCKLLFKHHPVNIAFTFKLELRVAMSDLCDCERRLQINLHFVSRFQSLESDHVRSFQTPGFRQELHAEVVMHQIPPF